MACQLKTTTLLGGFETIAGLDFRKSLLSSGKDMIPHTLNVREIRKSDENGQIVSITIAADCIREMSLTEKPWNVTLEINPVDRSVSLARCSCTAGADGLCKHTSAVFQFVNSERSEGCTDSQQIWAKPSAKLNDLYPKGVSIQQLFFKKAPAKRDFSGANIDVEKVTRLMEKHSLQNSSVYKTLTVDTSKISVSQEQGTKVTANVSKKIEEILLRSLVRREPEQDFRIVSTVTKWQHFFLMSLLMFGFQNLKDEHERFYQENIAQTASDPVTIFKTTLGQSTNSQWYLHRKHRVTASIARKIAKGRRPDLRVKYFLEDLRPTRGMMYGREMEPIAREQYKILFKKDVHEAGLIVNKTLPWLAASVDGLAVEDDGSVTVLEIKCPSSCEDAQIDVDYIVNGSLKRSHPYYTQVQVQMLLCHSKKCDFFVFSMADHVLIEVPLDEDFI